MKYILYFIRLLLLAHFIPADAQVIQSPFSGSPVSIPGVVEAENYDLGGQGVAYYDTNAINEGGRYRLLEGVDIEDCREGGHNIAYMATGEWMEYTVTVQASSGYRWDLRTASDQFGCAIRLDVDDSTVTLPVTIPNTSGWQNWATTSVPSIYLSAGQHVLRLFVVAGGFNLNSFTFSNRAPVVSIIAPSNGTMFTAPASFSINANATDTDGTISKVEFYNGTALLGTATAAPYSFSWSNVQEGRYTVTARAIDNTGNATVSSAVVITVLTLVIPNQPPNVTLTAPVHRATANAPANLFMSAEATDSDGKIDRVEFYHGSVLIGSDKTDPYTYVWMNAGAGVYSITARAIDDKGASKTSTAAVVSVLAVVTDVCVGLSKYIENGGYVAGNKVKNGEGRYECKGWPYSGWCNGAAWAYSPGEGAYWSDAWNLLGTCGGNSRSFNTREGEEFLQALTASPNPFHDKTSVSVALKESGDVALKLYDKNGLLIRTLMEGYLLAGLYDFMLNMEHEQTGMYLIKCTTPDGIIMTKIMKAE